LSAIAQLADMAVRRAEKPPIDSLGLEQKLGGHYPKRVTGRLKTLPWIEIGILALAAVLRIALLDIKPPHFDEGVNGWFVDQMTRNGFFRYDPTKLPRSAPLLRALPFANPVRA
jgi:hypothetical protein